MKENESPRLAFYFKLEIRSPLLTSPLSPANVCEPATTPSKEEIHQARPHSFQSKSNNLSFAFPDFWQSLDAFRSSALIGFLWHLELLSVGPTKLGSLALFVDQLVFQGHIKQIQGIAQTRASNLLFTFTDAFLDIRSHLIALTLHLSHPMINL